MLGKIDTPLNQKLQQVKWGEYRVGDLFDINNTLSFNANVLVDGDEYDYVTRTSLNQGILQTTGFVNNENINQAGVWSLGLLQMDFFYRRKPWYAGQFVRKIIPKFEITSSAILFFTTLLNRLKKTLLAVLVRDVDKTFLNSIIQVPINENNDIDFKFIAEFVAELEAQRVAELEAQRVAELETYLQVTGLRDYDLSNEEQNVFARTDIEWSEYSIGKLFERISCKKLPYKAKDLPKQQIGEHSLPCLTSSFQNQGLNYYAPRTGATILKNVISIPSNSDVYRAYYQSEEFTVLSDAYAIRWKNKKMSITDNQYLFMVMCINKVTDLPIYSYKNKLGGWNVVCKKDILLPTKNGEIDFEYMETYIQAIKKMAIKDVVTYADRKIAATREVIDK